MASLTTEQEQAIRDAYTAGGSMRGAMRATGHGYEAVSRVLGPMLATGGGIAHGLDYDLLASKVAALMKVPPNEGPPTPTLPLQKPARAGVTVAPKRFGRIVWLSDIHVPYHDQAAVNAALDFARDWKPDLLILGGDLFDCYSISRYEKSPDQLNDRLQEEFDCAKPIVRDVAALGCEVVLLLGNHEARLDAMIGGNPGLAGLRALGWPRMAELPATWTILPSQSRYRVGPIDFLHGDLKGRGGGAKHIGFWMLDKIKRSSVFGHYHRAQTFYDPDGDGVVRAGFATGHLCDPIQAAAYCPVNAWSTGFASIDMEPETGLFEFRTHLIHGGKFRHGGKTYGG